MNFKGQFKNGYLFKCIQSLRIQGYLFLATEEGATLMEESHRIQVREGARVVLYSPSKLKADFPWLNTDGLVLGSFGLENEGWFDPWALLNGFRQKAASTKTQFIHGMFFVHLPLWYAG